MEGVESGAGDETIPSSSSLPRGPLPHTVGAPPFPARSLEESGPKAIGAPNLNLVLTVDAGLALAGPLPDEGELPLGAPVVADLFVPVPPGRPARWEAEEEGLGGQPVEYLGLLNGLLGERRSRGRTGGGYRRRYSR